MRAPPGALIRLLCSLARALDGTKLKEWGTPESHPMVRARLGECDLRRAARIAHLRRDSRDPQLHWPSQRAHRAYDASRSQWPAGVPDPSCSGRGGTADPSSLASAFAAPFNIARCAARGCICAPRPCECRSVLSPKRRGAHRRRGRRRVPISTCHLTNAEAVKGSIDCPHFVSTFIRSLCSLARAFRWLYRPVNERHFLSRRFWRQ